MTDDTTKRIESEISKSGWTKILVWTAGGATRQFLSQISPQLAGKIAGVVDSNPALDGKNIGRYAIHSPEHTDFSTAQAIIITSPVFHEEIKSQIASIKAFRGQIIDIFEERLKLLGIEKWLEETNAHIRRNGLRPILFNGEDALLLTKNDTLFCFDKNMQNNQIIMELLQGGQYEKEDVDFVISRVGNGQVMLDIGANVGWFTIHAAKRYPNLVIHAFEPSARTHATLEKNIRYNHVEKNAHAHRSAVGEQDGVVRFTATLDTGNHIGTESGANMVEVPCTTLDSFAKKEGLARVDFIKCDIEGAELMMLKGASKLLARHHPMLMLEINESWAQRFGYLPKDIQDYLAKLDYDMFVLDKNGQLHAHDFSASKSSDERNFIFVHKSLGK